MTGWIVSTLVATALLMLFVLMLRPFVRPAFGAGAAYALWLIPALRLIMPTIEFQTVAASPLAPVALAVTVAEPGGGGWLVWAWAAGALLFAGWHVAGYRRFLARVSADARPLASGVVATRAVDGPAAVGLLVGRILVPHDFADRFSPVERDLALRHEHVHLARGDLWANAVALGLLSLHWFNPLAHIAYRAFRQDQELSCDAAVIAASGSEERAAYGAVMVKAAHGDAWGTRAAPMMTCPMTRTRNLKRRLKMIRAHKTSALATTGGICCFGLATLAGLTLTATSGIAAQPVAEAGTVIVKRMQGSGGLDTALVDPAGAAQCRPEAKQALTEALTEQQGKPVKVTAVLCGSKANAPAGERIAMMQKARANIVSSSNLNDVERGKIIAALDGLIEKVKAE